MNRPATALNGIARPGETATADLTGCAGLPPVVCPAPADRTCRCDVGSVIDLGLNVDDLGSVRFAADAVWETVASLCVLSHPRRHQLHHRLSELAADPRYDLGLLLDLVALERWYPVFLCPEPRPGADPETALAAVAGTPAELAERDLEAFRHLAPTNHRWQQTTAEQLLDQTSTALLGYWRQVLLPMWERISDIVEADLSLRSRQVTSLGLAAALAELHDDLSLHDGHVRVRLPGHHRHLSAQGNGLWFVPTVFRWPRVVVEIDAPAPLVGYPARGPGRLWEAAAPAPPAGLRQVLGHSRVVILTHLDVATTTTRLARELHLSPGTVSAHLTAMTRAGLLEPSRRGREVLYRRTPLGDTLAAGR